MANSNTLQEKFRSIHRNASVRYKREAAAQALPAHEMLEGDIFMTPSYATIASEDTLADNGSLDALLDWYCQLGDQYSAASILYWTSSHLPSTDLDIRMLARGISNNWKPHWMWLDLSDFDDSPAQEITGYSIAETSIEQLRSQASLQAATAEANPDHFRVVTALDDCGLPVGSCALNLTDGEDHVGGLYDLYVMPKHQRKGIGTALTREVCRIAKAAGCQHLYLNATADGELLYRKMGFQSLGDGWSWHLKRYFNTVTKPDGKLVRFLEALGRGDIIELDMVRPDIDDKVLNELTTNGLTPLEFAVHFKQRDSMQWLMRNGVIPDLVSLWDMEMREEAQQLIHSHPLVVNTKAGELGATALHVAVERNDFELAKMVLTSDYDFGLRDEAFGSTAVQWAEHFERKEMAELLGPFQAK